VLFVSVPLQRQGGRGQMKLVVSLAEMGGTAMHRMRLHEETVKRLEQLQALHAVDLGIAGSLDLRLITRCRAKRGSPWREDGQVIRRSGNRNSGGKHSPPFPLICPRPFGP
jgi:hypothetical protein